MQYLYCTLNSCFTLHMAKSTTMPLKHSEPRNRWMWGLCAHLQAKKCKQHYQINGLIESKLTKTLFFRCDSNKLIACEEQHHLSMAHFPKPLQNSIATVLQPGRKPNAQCAHRPELNTSWMFLCSALLLCPTLSLSLSSGTNNYSHSMWFNSAEIKFHRVIITRCSAIAAAKKESEAKRFAFARLQSKIRMEIKGAQTDLEKAGVTHRWFVTVRNILEAKQPEHNHFVFLR